MGLLDDVLVKLRETDPDTRATITKDLKRTDSRIWVPNSGPQERAYESDADELFYGGTAGSGKSQLGLGLALTKHKRSLILRRFNRDAVKLADRVEEILGHRDGYNGQERSWRLPDNRRIDFGGCEHEADKHRYKGDARDLIVWDEGSDFLYSQYRFITAW